MAKRKNVKRTSKKQAKLRRFELRWVEHKKHGKGWMLFLNGRAQWDWSSLGYYTKQEAIERARLEARWNEETKPSQLYVCNKKGRYQTEWTYPKSRDPRKSKGSVTTDASLTKFWRRFGIDASFVEARRFINWNDVHPTNEQLEGLLVGYFDGMGKVHWEVDRWFIDLPDRATEHALYSTERWIEVWPSRTGADVMTRHQDQIMNAIAVGLVDLIVNTFQASRE